MDRRLGVYARRRLPAFITFAWVCSDTRLQSHQPSLCFSAALICALTAGRSMVRMFGSVIWSLPRQQLRLVSLGIICYKLSNRTPNFTMQISLCVRILHSCSLMTTCVSCLIFRSLHGSCCVSESCDILEASASCKSSTTACAWSQRKAHSCSATPGEHFSLLQQYCSLLHSFHAEGNASNGRMAAYVCSRLKLCV